MLRGVQLSAMLSLKAYLSNPKVRKALSRRPGDQGFSLIELVVVVAVLAILAAIAVPAYMGMNEKAADSASLTNLKNAYKECAYQVANGANNNGTANPMYDKPANDAYYTYASSGTSGQCDSPAAGNVITATKGKGTNSGKTMTINVLTGSKGGDMPGWN